MNNRQPPPSGHRKRRKHPRKQPPLPRYYLPNNHYYRQQPLEENLSAVSEHMKLFSKDNIESNHEDESPSLDNILVVKKRKSDATAAQSHKILKRDGTEISNNVLREESVTDSDDTSQNSKQQEESVTASEDIDVTLKTEHVLDASHDLSQTENLTFQNVDKQLCSTLKLDKQVSSKETFTKVILKEEEAIKDRSDTGTPMNFGKNIIFSDRNTGFSAFTTRASLSNKDQQTKDVNESELPSHGDPIIEQNPASNIPSMIFGIVNTELYALTRNARPGLFSEFTKHHGPGSTCSAFTSSQMPNASSFNFIHRDSKKAKYAEPPSNGEQIIEQHSASKVPSLILEEEVGLKDIPDSGIYRDVSVMNVGLEGQLEYGKNVFSSDMNAGISAITGGAKASSSEKDQLSSGTVTPQQVITGRAAELLAFKSVKLDEKSVKCDTFAEGKDNKGVNIECNHEDETCLPSQSQNSSQDIKSSEQFIGSPSLDTIVKKRKSDAIDCTAFQSHKNLKRDGVGQSSAGTKISNIVLHKESVTASENIFQNSKQQEESVTASEGIDVILKTEHALPILVKKYFDKPSLEACMSHHLMDGPVAQASHDVSETENLTFQNAEKQLPYDLDKEGSSKVLKEVAQTNKTSPVSESVNSISELHRSSKENPAKVILKEGEAIKDRSDTGTPMNFGKNIIFSGFSAFATWASLSNKDQQNSVTKDNESELPSNGDPIIEQKPASKMPSMIFGIVNTELYALTRNVRPGFSAFTGDNGPGCTCSEFTSSDMPNASLFNLFTRDSEPPSNGDQIIEQHSASKVPSLILEENVGLKDIPDSGICRDVSVMNVGLEGQLDYGKNVFSSDMNAGISAITGGTKSSSSEKDQPSSGTVTPQQVITGSAAELLAFESAKLDEKSVKCDTVSEGKDNSKEEDSAKKVIELIRREKFGLNPDTSTKEDNTLKKQHALLGRALQCLSKELYSQDSHFLLELVQNADDNVYPCDVEPTLNFILQETGIVVLNNEQGFSAENIEAVCDVGNSTKKEPSAGYIGKKGIGFKSVFRVTDAPEIHSNGFHIKFDVSDGQIGYVLPTNILPCCIDSFSKLISLDTDPMDKKHWNTCIILPFRSKKNEAFSVENLKSMFSNLHPSLLLFLHRLKCIKFRNLLNDSLTVMRKVVTGNGTVNVSTGKEKMTWFVKSGKFKASHKRHDVQTTTISVAFMLEDLNNGNCISKLEQQPVFAFLPIRNYGFKFIIQADFTLSSSREEVDGSCPWNKWLLDQLPNLFVKAERSFCSRSCFKENPAKGVSVFMSFVPFKGEVDGFFSQLPDKIISKLRKSDCLLLEGDGNVWVPPSKVLRNWTETTRSLLPDSLIKEHLGLGYLNKDIVLTDSLARALEIKECGPTILIQLMTSVCDAGSLKSMGLKWLSSWLNALYLMTANGSQSDVIHSLCQLPFIPLTDGSYASIQKGAIWLHTDSDHRLEAFKKLYSKLRIVNPALFSDSHDEKIALLLDKVGVQRLSAHDILKRHILPVVSDKKFVKKNKQLMIEYLSFIMFHLESTCSDCLVQKGQILSKLRNSAFISTKHGYKRLVDVPIHFSKDFGNPIDMRKLVFGTDMQWFEIDNSYLKHPVFESLPDRTQKWRKFLQELGVTDFVKIVKVEKRVKDISHAEVKKMMLDDGCISSGSVIEDWDSQELSHLLSRVSSNDDMEKVKYLLEVLDTLWDDYFSDKLTGFCIIKRQRKPFKASVIRILHDVRWLASSMDDQLHFPKDLFRNCEMVHALLGDNAPYCIPKVNSLKLLNDIGIKDAVNLDDALSVLEVWRRSEKPFRASLSQMLKLYTYIWNEMSISKQKIVECLHAQAFIFVPYSFNSTLEVVSGLFLSPSEVYWHDSIFSSMEQTKLAHPHLDQNMTRFSSSKMLCNVYPGLHYFFVNEFGVAENPPLLSYLQSLQELSTRSSPSQAAKTVFQVLKKWSVGLECGSISSDDIDYLKKSMEEKEMKILPTVKDKWVSLHQSFGLICWCDDDQLRNEFVNANNIDFLCLGDHNNEEKQLLQDKVSVLFQRLGIPSLSEVVTREAIYYDLADNSYENSLVSWALPYAQRYIFSLHPTEYTELKLSGFENLHSLQIVVVGKLSYKNVIKKCGIESNNLCECSCLLQNNVLYATHKSDSHPLFKELSHLLLAGIHEFHLANFLYMITTMAKSGFTEEKMEFFIINSQKLPTLPSEESQWSLASTSSPEEGLNPPFTTSKEFGKPISWPPVNWKPAPRFEDVSKTKDVTAAEIIWDVTEGLHVSGDDWIIEESPALPTTSVILEEDESPIDQSESVIKRDIVSFYMDVGSRDQSHYGKSIQSSDMHAGSSTIIRNEGPPLTTTSMILEEDESSKNQPESGINKDVVSSDTDVGYRDQPRYGKHIQSPDMNSASSAIIRYNEKHTFTPQEVTGRTGEHVAFKYFSEKLGDKTVKWVNEVKESGLPYDIVVESKDDDSKEYIEVKSTSLARKDWFGISLREWQFAVEKGDSFSIARVVLSHGKLAQIAIYRNPVELCQSRQLQLCIRSAK